MVTINNELLSDYDLILLHKEIGEAQPKRNEISIPLTDGSIDLTRVLSPVMFYENRLISMEFELMKYREDWQDTMIDISNRYHGSEVEICFLDDPDHVWRGVASVGALDETHGVTAGVTIEVNAKPFRRTKNSIHEETVSVSGTKNVTITHNHKRAYLNIIPTAQMNVTVNEEVQTFTAQKHDVEFTLTASSTQISLSGNGSAKLVLYGGDL